MATTENIGLKLFEGSDYVSREDINANNSLIDANLGIDHVVERGKSGDWEWVKWSSGFMEQWISRKAFPTQTFRAWGSLKATPWLSFGNFPIAFTAPPLCMIQFVDADDASTTFGSFIANMEGVTTTTPPKFALIDPMNSITTIGTPYFGIYARGYWK